MQVIDSIVTQTQRNLCTAIALLAVPTFSAQMCAWTGFSMTPLVAWLNWTAGIGCSYFVWRKFRQSIDRNHRVEPVNFSSIAATITLFAAAMLYIYLWISAILRPDFSWDGNAYHLPAIHFWLHERGIHWISQPSMAVYLDYLLNGYPKGIETVGFLAIAATGASELSNTINLLFLPLGVLGIVLLSRTIGASSSWAVTAGALYIFIPVNVSQSATMYVDSAFASCFIAHIALAASLFRIDRHTDPSVILALGASGGLALGAKQTALAFVPATLTTLGLLAVTSVGMRRNEWRSHLTTLLIVSAIVIGVGGGWYIRNWIRTGSPIYPMGLSIAGRQIFSGESVQACLPEKNYMPEELVNLPWYERLLTTWTNSKNRWPKSVISWESHLGGFGVLWMYGAVPALLMAVMAFLSKHHPLRMDSFRTFSFAFFVCAFCFIITPMNWWARYTVWIYGVGLAAFSLILSLSDQHLRLRYFARTWFCVLLGIAICEALVVAFSLSCQSRLFDDPYSLWKANPWRPFDISTWKHDQRVYECSP